MTMTGVLMVPSELEALYSACYASGIETILINEGVGVDNIEGIYPEFSENKPTVHFGGVMFSHDHGYYLRRAGYSVGDPIYRLTNGFNPTDTKAQTTVLAIYKAKLA